MTRRRSLLPAATAAAVLLLTAACGTTVPLAERQAMANRGAGGQLGAGSSLTGDTVVTGDGAEVDTGTTGPGPAGAAAGSAAGSTAAGAGRPGAANTTATTARPAIPTTGPGWDKNFVYIGVTTQKDVQAVATNLGADGLDGGDQEAEALAVAGELNRRGGIFGRQVKVVFRDHGTVGTANDPNTEGAATCTFYTQDRPVIAVLNPVTLLDAPSFRACLAKARVPLFSASVAPVDKEVGAALSPHFYQMVAPTWDALAPVLVARLKAQNYFTGWNPVTGGPGANPVKVGVLTPDDEVGARTAKLVVNALAGAGYRDSVVYQASGADQMNGAVLQFNGNGVTHLIATSADLFAFTLTASSQGYRPRYGITSINAPVTFLQTNSPRDQLNGAMGVGWSASLDVDDARDPGDAHPGEAECRRIQAAAGQRFEGKRLAEAVAFAFCDGLGLIAQSAIAGGGLTAVAMEAGLQRVAPTFKTAFSFANGLGPGRLFVPGGVRDLVWNAGGGYMQYVSADTHKL